MKKAVTLVELIVAIVIIAILAGLAIPKQSGYIEDGFEAAFDAVERNMYNNVELIAINYQQGIEKILKYKDLTAGANTPVHFDSWKNADGSYGPSTIQLHDGTNDGTISAGGGTYTCEQIFHALSGVGAKTASVDLGFGEHAYDNSGETTGLICEFKTPEELGKAQRVYEYNAKENTLTRTS